jgi:hypothetical protein
MERANGVAIITATPGGQPKLPAKNSVKADIIADCFSNFHTWVGK